MKYKGITIHKNKNCDTWYTRFRNNGTQTYISAKTQKECYNKLKRVLAQTDNAPILKPKSITFIEWYNKWIELYKKDIKDETKRDYTNLLKNLKTIQNKEINKILIEDILKILNSMQAERQKQKVYELLNMIFKKAQDNEIIEKNIMSKIDKPKHEKSKGIALTQEEQKIFINSCKSDKYGNLYLFMLYQGLRIGETLALNYEDIKNNYITINKQLTNNGIVNYTKNKQSTRTIPLFEKTKQILNLNNKGRIFDFTETTANRNLKRIIKNQNIPQNLTTHDLRHTFITNCQNKQIPEYVIQALVGHEIGSKVTKQIYTHFNLKDNLSYIDKLND